ncbi:MAG: hypothetical protein GXO86_03480 [Chlorobi bacterium]|nr:hypothetical protein [Chlorobiota bacterium]
MILALTLLYIILNVILSVIETDKQQELFKIFLIGLFFTPVAIIGFLQYKKKNSKRVHFYYCRECDYVFPVKMKHCPICEEQGKKVKLSPYRSPYRLTKQIRTITL